MTELKYTIKPVAKPRMTQRDKWFTRSCVSKYWRFKEECKALKMQIADSGTTIKFYIPMPKSWSNKKKAEMVGKPHQQKPDIDNFGKAIMDAIMDDDSGVYDIRLCKYWSEEGMITFTYE